jgi:hypothetical protein
MGGICCCYVVMGNHLHLLVKTLRPNLGAGMQSFLSGYAIWAGRRWRRLGHLFQGLYRAEMIEDESYNWTVSRYIHLNPVRALSLYSRTLNPVLGIDGRWSVAVRPSITLVNHDSIPTRDRIVRLQVAQRKKQVKQIGHPMAEG